MATTEERLAAGSGALDFEPDPAPWREPKIGVVETWESPLE
jgi:hypothetical protein